MRITVFSKGWVNLLILLVVVNSLCIPCLTAQEEHRLILEIYDYETLDPLEDNVFFEGKSYNITVTDELGIDFIVGVNITVPWATFYTSNITPIITLQAPSFLDYDSFIITATKKGYSTAEIEITVMKGVLMLSVDRTTVEEQKQFQVTVKDQNNTLVKHAYVYAYIGTNTDVEPMLTDAWGTVVLTAPEVAVDTTLTIRVMKNGYATKFATIRVEPAKGVTITVDNALLNQLLPLLFAVLVVIFAILLVRWRQKKALPPPRAPTDDRQQKKPQVSLQETPDRYGKHEHASFTVNEPKKISVTPSTSKVEEIRIPLQQKQKDITVVSPDKQSAPAEPKKDEDEYFKGQEYMRYKLDEITGKIDQQTDGKWFEGERDSKYKVDETLKKGWKKKKGDDEDTK